MAIQWIFCCRERGEIHNFDCSRPSETKTDGTTAERDIIDMVVFDLRTYDVGGTDGEETVQKKYLIVQV